MKDLIMVREHPRVFRCNGLANKKKIFEKMAQVLSSDSGISFNRVFDGLMAREKLGSTYINNGVAIPHCKLSVDSPTAAILMLDKSVKYSDENSHQVDIIFGLLVPTENSEQHLHLLSSIAKLSGEENWLNSLRELNNEKDIYNYLLEIENSIGEFL